MDKYDVNHIKHFKIVIKKLFRSLSDNEIINNIATFWSEYTYFSNKNCPFDGAYFLWKIIDIQEENRNLWHQKYSFQCKMVLGFVSCRLTSIIIGISAV